jgi:hypothetical protein
MLALLDAELGGAELGGAELGGAALAGAGLVGGGGVELGVATKLSGGVEEMDVWASMSRRTARSWAWVVDNSRV